MHVRIDGRTAEGEAVVAEDEAGVWAIGRAADVAGRTVLVGAGGLVVALVPKSAGGDGEELGVWRRLLPWRQRLLGGWAGSPDRPPRRRHAAGRQRQQERHRHRHAGAPPHHHVLASSQLVAFLYNIIRWRRARAS